MKNKKQKTYQVYYNKQHEKVCKIEDREYKIIAEDGKTVTLENGQKLYIQLKKDEKLEIDKYDVNDEYGNGDVILTVQSQEEKRSVAFSSTCPASAVKGKTYFEVVYSPSKGISKEYIKGLTSRKNSKESECEIYINNNGEKVCKIGDKEVLVTDELEGYLILENGKVVIITDSQYEEVEAINNGEGETRIGKEIDGKQEGAEDLINTSGKDLDFKGVYANYHAKGVVKDYQITGIPIPIPLPIREKIYQKIIEHGGVDNLKKDAKDKAKKALLILLIPIIIAVPVRSCSRQQEGNPDPKPDPDQGDNENDINDEDTIININIYIDEILQQISQEDNLPQLASIRQNMFEHLESIGYDLENFLPGNENIRKYLGDEYIGLSRHNNTPSDFYRKIDETRLKDDGSEIYKDYKTAVTLYEINHMSTEDLTTTIEQKGIDISKYDFTTDEGLLAAKKDLIKIELGYDLNNYDDSIKFLTVLNRYYEEQKTSYLAQAELAKKHAETTHESINIRQKKGVKDDTYPDEEKHHKDEAEECIKAAERTEKTIEAIKNGIDDLELCQYISNKWEEYKRYGFDKINADFLSFLESDSNFDISKNQYGKTIVKNKDGKLYILDETGDGDIIFTELQGDMSKNNDDEGR